MKKILIKLKEKKRQVVNSVMIKLKNKGYTYRQLVEDYQDICTLFVVSFLGNIILIVLLLLNLFNVI